MSNHNNLNHCTWECKYHIVFTPKYRKKSIFGLIRKELKDVFRKRQITCILQKENNMI
jgi:putative transposase